MKKAALGVAALLLIVSHGPAAAQSRQAANFEITQIVPNGRMGEYTHGTYPSEGDRTHAGIDIPAPCGSSPILAWRDGTVIDVVSTSSDRNFNSLGYMVLIDHGMALGDKRTYSISLHMDGPPKVGSIILTAGHPVRAGQQIGFVGKTGAAKGCHVHFELRHFASRFSPVWQNIYGNGDRRNSAEFLRDWTDPLGGSAAGVPERMLADYRDDFLATGDVSGRVTSLARLRDKPTVNGSIVLRTLQVGTMLYGRWVRGVDPTSRWLKVSDGGYVWDGNIQERANGDLASNRDAEPVVIERATQSGGTLGRPSGFGRSQVSGLIGQPPGAKFENEKLRVRVTGVRASSDRTHMTVIATFQNLTNRNLFIGRSLKTTHRPFFATDFGEILQGRIQGIGSEYSATALPPATDISVIWQIERPYPRNMAIEGSNLEIRGVFHLEGDGLFEQVNLQIGGIKIR